MPKALIAFFCITLLTSLAGCQQAPEDTGADSTPELETNKTADSSYQGQDWTLNNLAGETVSLSDFQGRPTLLVFWATWCPYCKKLLPGIEALNQKYENQGLKILAVNIREDWKPDVYWRNHEYTFDTVLAGDDLVPVYGVRGTPYLVFIAPSGEVLGVDSFADPNHPKLEQFAQEGIAMMKAQPAASE